MCKQVFNLDFAKLHQGCLCVVRLSVFALARRRRNICDCPCAMQDR